MQFVSNLEEIEKRLLAAAGEIDKAISAAVEDELDKLPDAVRRSAMEILPKKGGLNKLVAARVVPKTKRSPGSIQVFADGRQGLKELSRIDRGLLRHPVFADPDKSRKDWKWVSQKVNKRFWSRPVELRADEIKKAVTAALEQLARRI